MRNMPFKQRFLLSVAIMAGFILLVFAMLGSYIWATSGEAAPGFVEFLFRFHFEMMIAVSLLGIVVGAAMYFLMAERVQVAARDSAGNAGLLLSFLSTDERDVVEFLLKSEGHTTQAQVSRLEGMSRLRAHRVVGRLEEKKIVRIEKLGKTNQLWLAKSIYEALGAEGKKEEASKPEKTEKGFIDIPA
ncbi:Uncharacterised protein [uncultured archaeon]|nr:Uncharacterised protein [uncultured archaeon]